MRPGSSPLTVVPREAATVMLVRDAPALQVFMLRRSLDLVWVGGAHVFPGGAVDPEDRSPAATAVAPGRTDTEASVQLGVVHGGLGFWVAAIREAFEEAGVLLARDATTGLPVDLSDPTLAGRLHDARQALNARQRSFLDVVTSFGWELDVEALHPVSHWITPAGSPRRFDTWFFVAEAPDDHAYLHDDGEAMASEWVRPHDALAAADRGEIELIFPTRKSLEALASFERAAEVVSRARATSRLDDAGVA